MSYLLDNCCFNKLTSEIIDQCQPYRCSKDSGIDSFFHKNTKDNFSDYRSEMMGCSFCFHTDEDSPKMVCAFSLSNSSLRTDTLPKRKRNKFNKSIPNTKRRSQYPAILIGQLCVFDGFGHLNVGDEMMNLIKTMAIDRNNDCAARFLIVDAINNTNVINYYKRNKFDFLFDSDEEELKFLRGQKPHKSIIRKIIRLFRSADKQENPICKTRLMVFDLILLKQ